MIRSILPVIAALCVLLAAGPVSTTAQTTEEYQVAVAYSSLSTPVSARDVGNLGNALRTLTAQVGGATCTTETLTGATADVILHIGAPGQPEACSTEGATVTFVDGNGLTLGVSYKLRKGTRDTLINLAPLPPRDPDNSGPIDGATSGEFQVLVLASSMQLRIPIDPAPPEPVTLGSRIGVLTALANGEFCAKVNVANLQQDFVIRFGLPDQLPGCSLEGATVTFENAKGEQLMGSMVLHLGARETLRSFSPALVPPKSDGAPASPGYEILVPLEAARRFGSVTTYANGERCFTVDTAAATSDVILRFGGEGQPAACTANGSLIELADGVGNGLTQTFNLLNGARDTLTNAAPRPPHSPRPGQAAGSSPSITPPDTGDGGLQ